MSQLTTLLRPPGPNGRGGGPLALFGGGRGGAQAPIVGPSDYVVSITIDGKAFRRVLRVERASGTGAATSLFENDDQDP